MSLLEVVIQTETDRELIDGFLKLFDAGKTDSPQIKIFRKILLCFLDTTIDIFVGLFPILKVNMNDGPMIEKIRTVGIETTSLLHLLQSLNKNFWLFWSSPCFCCG